MIRRPTAMPKASKNLRPAALPRGARMAKNGDGQEGEQQGVKGGGESIVELLAELTRIVLGQRARWGRD